MKKLWPDDKDSPNCKREDGKYYPRGKDCICAASNRYECGCVADWSDNGQWNSRGEADKKAVKEALRLSKLKKYTEQGYGLSGIRNQILTDLFGEEGA